jgi:hypothetical protein
LCSAVLFSVAGLFQFPGTRTGRRNCLQIHYNNESPSQGELMPTHKAEAEWKGDLAQGSGRLKVGDSAFDVPYSFESRFEEGLPAANPEELIGLAGTALHPSARLLQPADGRTRSSP